MNPPMPTSDSSGIVPEKQQRVAGRELDAEIAEKVMGYVWPALRAAAPVAVSPASEKSENATDEG